MPTGTITTGGQAQPLFPEMSARRGFLLQNNSAEDLRVSVGGVASPTSGIKIPSGAYYESPPGSRPVGAVTIFGATTGSSFDYDAW